MIQDAFCCDNPLLVFLLRGHIREQQQYTDGLGALMRSQERAAVSSILNHMLAHALLSWFA